MTDLEIVEELREAGGEDFGNEAGGNSVDGKSTKRRRSRKRRNSGSSEGPVKGFPLGQDPKEKRKENASGGQNGVQRVDARKSVDLPSTQEDPRSEFYGYYRKEAEEYDKEFMKKYEEDLDTTLIFAGLFSAVTSAFILDVQSQLQPDTGDETAALLRVLIYKIDNTTFGNDTPTLPRWTGPPHAIVQVQSILYASLAAALLSAFLAMLGKQWLNRYASTNMRGTTIERSQNRQRKLDGIIKWYFDHVMESLPLMLQIALLLLGCALSRYLWEINITVASVVLSVTLFGIVFYLFIVVAGAVSETCPYQTPGSFALRYLEPKVQIMLHSALPVAASVFRNVLSVAITSVFRSDALDGSKTVRTIKVIIRWHQPWWSRSNIVPILKDMVHMVPRALVTDVYQLGRAMAQSLVTFSVGACHLGPAIFWLLAGFPRRVYSWSHSASPTSEQGLDQQTTVLDLRCISWILQTSLDRTIRLPTLKHLVTMAVLPDFDPTLVAGCFGVFISSINVNNHKVVIIQGLEELATLSAMCFLRTFHHLSVMDPTSSVLEDVRRRHDRVFPFGTDFGGFPLYYAMAKIHGLVNRTWGSSHVQWDNYRPSTQEHVQVARDIAEAAQVGYQQSQHQKVPRWILRFALSSLSIDPPPPPPVVSNCLSVVAIDLDCDVSNIRATTLDESARVEKFSSLITEKLKTMAEAEDHRPLRSKRKAITALLPCAVWRERDGQPEMFDTILLAIRASRMLMFMWRHIDQFVSTLFSEASPRTIVLASPHIHWYQFRDAKSLVRRWTAAASAIPYSEEIAQGVVDTLLQIASEGGLQYTPVDLWPWLTKRPSLPPICWGRYSGTYGLVVEAVRAPNDIEAFKSYLLLVWSEWDTLRSGGFNEMCTIIREDFSGIEMGHHRTDLIQRLDHVLTQLDRGLEYIKQHKPWFDEDDLQSGKSQYRKLRETLMEMNTQSRATFMCSLPPPCP